MKQFVVILFFLLATKSLAQIPLTTIPFELYGEHLFIKLTVNNSDEELDFIFDTGDGLSVLSLDAAERLDLKSNKKTVKTSAGGRVSGYLVKHNVIHLKNIEIKNVKLYETSLNHLETAIGRRIDGIIGYDLMNNFVVEIDYNSMEFHIYKTDGYKYSGEGKAINIRYKHAIPYVPGVVLLNNGDLVQGSFYLDTGARTDLDFNTPFVNSKGLKDKVGDTYSYVVTGLSDHETAHIRGRVEKFSLAGYTFNNLPVGLSQESVGIQSDTEMAGIVGNDILHRFNIVLDYKNHKMWWSKNSKFDGPFLVNSSGIFLQLDKTLKHLLIHRVNPGSPADEAGLLTNDEILEVNGKSFSQYTLPEVRELLAMNHGKVDLKVKTTKGSKKVTLQLRELI